MSHLEIQFHGLFNSFCNVSDKKLERKKEKKTRKKSNTY